MGKKSTNMGLIAGLYFFRKPEKVSAVGLILPILKNIDRISF